MMNYKNFGSASARTLVIAQSIGSVSGSGDTECDDYVFVSIMPKLEEERMKKSGTDSLGGERINEKEVWRLAQMTMTS